VTPRRRSCQADRHRLGRDRIWQERSSSSVCQPDLAGARRNCGYREHVASAAPLPCPSLDRLLWDVRMIRCTSPWRMRTLRVRSDTDSKRGQAGEHTKQWAEKIGSYDGFIFVTPEYNHSTSGVLKNAIDYLYAEWNNKAAALSAMDRSGAPVRSSTFVRQHRAADRSRATQQLSFSLFTDFENFSTFAPGSQPRTPPPRCSISLRRGPGLWRRCGSDGREPRGPGYRVAGAIGVSWAGAAPGVRCLAVTGSRLPPRTVPWRMRPRLGRLTLAGMLARRKQRSKLKGAAVIYLSLFVSGAPRS
jgi:hypothetical protein